jgi:hypothetical protein
MGLQKNLDSYEMSKEANIPISVFAPNVGMCGLCINEIIHITGLEISFECTCIWSRSISSIRQSFEILVGCLVLFMITIRIARFSDQSFSRWILYIKISSPTQKRSKSCKNNENGKSQHLVNHSRFGRIFLSSPYGTCQIMISPQVHVNDVINGPVRWENGNYFFVCSV